MKLQEVSGGAAAADVGEAISTLADHNVSPKLVTAYMKIATSLIKAGADVTIHPEALSFTTRFFRVTLILNTTKSGFGNAYLDDVESIMYGLNNGKNPHIDKLPALQAAKIDWKNLIAQLSTAEKISELVTRSFAQ